jgi:hypothetical protein
MLSALARTTRRQQNSGVESIGRGWSLIVTRRSTSMHRLEAKRKEKRSILEAKQNAIFHKRGNIYISTKPSD